MKESSMGLSENWEIKKLKKVAKIYSGIGFPKNLQGKSDGEYPFYKVGDISKNVQNGKYNLPFCENFIDKKELNELRGKLIPKGTVVFAKIGEALKLNRRGIINRPSLIDNNAIGIKSIDDLISDKYMFYLWQDIRLEDYSRATTVPSVRKTDIEEIEIPVPPLPTQNRIVEKIDELFSELDNGVENLQKAQQQLKTYRQAVLKDAFEGKLTKEWREKHDDLPTPEELLQQIKAERKAHRQPELAEWEKEVEQWEKDGKPGRKPSKPRKALELNSFTSEELSNLDDLPKNWKWIKIDQIINHDQYALKAGPFGSALKKEFYVDDGYKVYGQEQVIGGNHKIGDYYIDEDKFEQLSSCKISPRDILISLVGTVGKVLILPEEIEPGVINPRLVKISVNQ